MLSKKNHFRNPKSSVYSFLKGMQKKCTNASAQIYVPSKCKKYCYKYANENDTESKMDKTSAPAKPGQ